MVTVTVRFIEEANSVQKSGSVNRRPMCNSLTVKLLLCVESRCSETTSGKQRKPKCVSNGEL
jgi:hypothetical protein